MVSASKTAHDRSEKNRPNYSAKGRDEWRREEGEIRDAFCIDLAFENLRDFPTSITDRVFSMAWEDEHSAGYGGVESRYEDLAEFVTFIRGEL
jgi:hypothetical protein